MSNRSKMLGKRTRKQRDGDEDANFSPEDDEDFSNQENDARAQNRTSLKISIDMEDLDIAGHQRPRTRQRRNVIE